MTMPLFMGMAWFHVYPKQQHFFYPDRVLPAVTGGFGEVSCHSCHFDGDLNQKNGSLDLRGLPEVITAGKVYDLEVELKHPQLAKAGFQLSIRTPAGDQVGSFVSIDERTLVQAGPDGKIQYMNHSEKGSAGFNGSATWKFKWKAGDNAGPIVLNLAANAANGDDSEFGDYIYVKDWGMRIED